MKKHFQLICCIALIFLVSCTSQDKKSTMDNLVSNSENTYTIHLFYEDNTELDNEILLYWNSQQKLRKIIQGIQLYDVSRDNNNQIAKALEIKDFPVFIVMNNKEIVLKSDQMTEVKDFFDKLAP